MEEKKVNVGNVPNLRFPGFEGEWKSTVFTEVCKIGTGNKNTQDREQTGMYPFFVRSATVERINTATFEGEAILTAGDGVGVGKVFHYIKGKFGVHQRVYILSDFKDVIGKFLFYYFSSRFNDRVSKLSAKNSVDSVRHEMIAKMPLNFPNIQEQSKIANLISLIDDRISTQSKIIEDLKLLSNSLSKKIFASQLKFKERLGNSYPEWSITTLGDIGETYSGLTGKTKEHFGTGKPYIQYKQVFDQSKIDISRCEFVSIHNNEFQAKVKKGDVFFTISSETSEEIGMSSVLLDEVEELYLNSFCFGYRPNSLDELLPIFARYLFRSELVRNEIIKLAQGSTRYNMSKLALKKLKICLPSKEEQFRIGNLLNTLDTKIDVEQTLLKKLKQQKQYLLSNLFK